MSKTPSTALKTASVLAFERKLDPSDALFFAGDWARRGPGTEWVPVTLREKSVRGTISNRMKGGEKDDAKLNAQMDKPNLQTVDVASLPPGSDTLLVRFSLRVLGGAGQPSACNDLAYQAKLAATVRGYVEAHGFMPLARRYAFNLANGRFLWRNRVGAEAVQVQVEHWVDGRSARSWQFDALDWSLRDFTPPVGSEAEHEALAQLIAQGLAGEGHVLLQVSAWARLGEGQDVYPSQELILDKQEKSKTLYHVQGTAGMHSQKLGNALRQIDTWYEGAADLGPIAVEPYGSVTAMGEAFRRPSKTPKLDFYNLFDNWLLKDAVPPAEQQHYVMANLVRGGVFGASDKE